MTVPINQILPVFFAAMRNGYAGNVSKSTISELPGSKVIRYKHDDFEVVDCYFVTPHSDYSFGTTTIYYQNNAVWMMKYWGRYSKELIPFLKRALQQTYEKSEFVGGRGPHYYEEKNEEKGDFFYENHLTFEINDWRNFRGRETISYSPQGIAEGWHEYIGLLLVH